MEKKFNNPLQTIDGSDRAFVEAKKLSTVWFNTGTLCNIACKNCYIESSPTNHYLTIYQMVGSLYHYGSAV